MILGRKLKGSVNMLENLITQFKQILYPIAEISAYTLELVGIIIIIVGSIRALIRLINYLRLKQSLHLIIDLRKALSLALEFKMGAEIIKTVIIHNLEELAILGVVIIIRALLAFIIHWEIRNELKDNAAINNN